MKRMSFAEFVVFMRFSYSLMFEPNENYTLDFIDWCNLFGSDVASDPKFPKDSQVYEELRSYLVDCEAQSQCWTAFEELWYKYEEYLRTGEIPILPKYKHHVKYQNKNICLKGQVQ